MKIYYAGGESLAFNKILTDCNVQNRLVSFYYMQNLNLDVQMTMYNQFNNILLDSGAFSAWKKGFEIDLDSYIEYLKSLPQITNYFNLDVIGNAEGSYKNYISLYQSGFKTIPVFHPHEDVKYLEKYLESTDYISLGGTVGRSSKLVKSFLDSCFAVIKKYWPIKVHGLGITSSYLLKRYPFYSVDSTSWLVPGRFGTSFKKSGFADISMNSNSEFNSIKSKILPYEDLNKLAVKVFLNLEEELTQLWEHRGILWNE